MELPIEKQTTLGLYAKAKEAYDKWVNSPEKVKILDVRTLDEYINIGHPAMSWNIPVFFQTRQWDAEKRQFTITPNPDFKKEAQKLFQPDDTLYVMCRSGGRSAFAVNELAALGFKKAFNVVDGFEGDMVKDPESAYHGKRMRNGWKNSGAPWTYEIEREHICV
jgi:rhodanese-related sulfurtransferase